MVNEQYTERLRILLAGRPLPYAEAMRWQHVLSRQRRFFPVLCITLLVFLALEMLFSLPFMLQDYPMLPLLVLLAVELTVAAVAVLFLAMNVPKQAAEEQWEWYNADQAARDGGVRIEFYETYLAMITRRSRLVMLFAEIVACVETEDGIALNDGKQWIVLRAQDMIDFDAKIVKAYLIERLGGDRVHSKAPMRAALTTPLPIPQPVSAPSAIVTATVPYQKTELYRRAEKAKRRRVSLLAVLMGATCGSLLPMNMEITPWLSLDLLILCGGGILFGWLVSLLVFAWYRPKKQPLTVAFYEDGVQIEVGGIRRFCVKEKLYMTAKNQQVMLQLGAKKKIHIPLSAADQPNVLAAFAGISEYMSSAGK